MSNKRIAILTDSTCDIPLEVRNKHNLHVIPQTIIWGDEVLLDGVDLKHAAFYKRIATDPAHPTTSQPTIPQFTEMYKKIAADADEIVTVLLSDEFSNTIASARGAAEEVDFPVHIVDSRSVSLGLGVVVMAAVEAREAGGDAAAMVEAAEKRAYQTNIIFLLDTLEYLHKGGRIGGAKRLIGTALNIKPLLHVDDGRVETLESVRTHSKALKRLVEVAADGLDTSGKLGGAVLYGVTQEDADKIAKEYKEKYQPQSFMMSQVTPVIGVHTGPGVVGIVTYTV